jgi:hypothetical protein
MASILFGTVGCLFAGPLKHPSQEALRCRVEYQHNTKGAKRKRNFPFYVWILTALLCMAYNHTTISILCRETFYSQSVFTCINVTDGTLAARLGHLTFEVWSATMLAFPGTRE